MTYFTNAGPRSGPILWRDGLGPIEVFQAPRDRRAIGKATPAGRTEGGIALWHLTLGHTQPPGRWLILGREFLPAPEGGRSPRG
jgi:hypothetical protein